MTPNTPPHPPGTEPAPTQNDEARPIKPHRSGGGAPFLNEAEDRKYAEWARAQDDDHLKHWATGTPVDRDALLKQIAAKREGQRRADYDAAGTEPATGVDWEDADREAESVIERSKHSADIRQRLRLPDSAAANLARAYLALRRPSSHPTSRAVRK